MYKKRIAAYCLTVALVLGNSFAVYATEADAAAGAASDTSASKTVAETVAGLDFYGSTISLTLEQALDAALTSGSSIKAAELQKESDTANAKSNSESYSDMNASNKDPDSDVSYSKSEMEKAQKAKEYYNSMAERNYQAAKNTITYNITGAYYSLLNAEEGVRITKENVRLQQELLTLVEQKLSLGVASKQEVLESEISLNSAQSSLHSAEVSLAEKKISFNIALGYDEMQDVNLTSNLETVELPELTVEQAVADALANRNELYTAAFNIYTAQKELNNYVSYPKSSATYLMAYKNCNSAQNSYNTKESQLKQEVRIDYADMISAKVTAENASVNVDKAKESYTISMEKYKLGLATANDVQKAQISLYEAEKSYAETILAFNLSTITYEMSATVGMGSY